MAGYRIMSIFQAIFIAVASVSVLDLEIDFGFNDLLFGEGASGWWSVFPFWAYLFALVAILQFIKAFTVKERR